MKIILILLAIKLQVVLSSIPLIINTWNFTNATLKAWEQLELGSNAVDAVVEGCAVCEAEQCDGTVGYGGSPDETGETTLDAMIMDGMTMNIGAVAGLRNIKDAIAVAKHVMLNTKHTMLVGDQATAFAVQMGFARESLATEGSENMWREWKAANCQPNFWTNVAPNPRESCGPYEPLSNNEVNSPVWTRKDHEFGRWNHDTIGMVVIDSNGELAAGTSTNGARNKIPGRVGDSPIPGSGAYADGKVGGAAATGDGDIMMRFLPSFLAVEYMRHGMSPSEAAANALSRIAEYYPDFAAGIVVASITGEYAAACYGLPNDFPFSVYNPEKSAVVVEYVSCLGIK